MWRRSATSIPYSVLPRFAILSTIAAVFGLAAPVTAAPASGEGSLPLRAHTVLTARGSTAIPIVVPQAFDLDPSHPGFTVSFVGEWAAFFVLSQPTGTPRRPTYLFGAIYQPAPLGCAAQQRGRSGCANGAGLMLGTYWPQAVVRGGTAINPYEGSRYHYPAGRYVAYLLAAPGSRIRVDWRLPAPAGTATATATRPVRASYVWAAAASTPVAAWLAGTPEQRLTRPGMVFDSIWAADQPGSQLESDAGHLCLERGASSPTTVVPRGDYCADIGSALPGPYSRQQIGTSGAISSATYGFSASGFTALPVPAGLYSVPYSIRATGQSPQVGAALLAWEISD